MQKFTKIFIFRQSPSEMGPGRYTESSEEHLLSFPPASVYITSQVKHQFYSLSEALAIHRLQQRPEIYDNPHAQLKLRIELNMTTDKAVRNLFFSLIYNLDKND